MRHLALLVAFTLTSHSAAAFEQDGLTSGMSESDALVVFSAFGDYDRTALQDNPDSWIFISKPPALTRIIQTCNGKLATYQSEIPGGWHAFMRTLERESRARGAGEYLLATGETTDGPSNSLSFKWDLDNNETSEIAFGQTGGSPAYAYHLLKATNACGL